MPVTASANLSNDVIAALSTAPGVGGVAMIRMSGQGVYRIADQLTKLATPPSQRPAGTFVHAPIYDGDGNILDDAVLLFYRMPKSYTGEDTIELCLHGGNVVSTAVLERLYQLGAHPAGPGEFTKRAFLNGRLDLTQAEAVADLIAARTPRAERAARANLQGTLGNALSPLYDDTLTLSVEVEHFLDFDEGELPINFIASTAHRLDALKQRVSTLLDTWHEGRLLREGALVVLAGKPNAGKSSLLNLLLGYNRAIVCDEPGTTRDSIEETFLLDGIPLRLTDTAGLRDAPGIVEHEGVNRARTLLQQADIVLYLVACDDDDAPPEGAILLRTKSDLTEDAQRSLPNAISVKADPSHARATVCNLLRDALKIVGEETPHATLATARQFTALTETLTLLNEACTAFHLGDTGIVPAAQRLRSAAETLGELLGRTYSDDLLDRVFSSFCVGK